VPLEAPSDTTERLQERFPEREPPIGPGSTLYRIYRSRDPQTGDERTPFFFASIPTDTGRAGGRYDLPLPHGSCYFGFSEVGAWLEVFRHVGVVDLADVRARRLCVTEPPLPVRTADLLARRAGRFGITGAIHAMDDYDLPRRWAKALFEAGFRSLHGKISHDPALEEESATLFDDAGAHAPYGWTWTTTITRLDTDFELLKKIVALGVRFAEPPYDVETETPTR